MGLHIKGQEEFITGVFNLTARNFIKELANYAWFDKRYVTDSISHAFLRELKKRKFIRAYNEEIDLRYYVAGIGGKELVLTDEGKAFARARACKLVRRDTAQKNLDKLKERIQEVNSDHKRFVIFVKVAVLFGSFINSDREFLGDLDIAVILSRKPNITKDEYENHKMGCSLIQALSNPTNEVLRHLKNRSTTIQIIDIYGQESAVFKDKHEFLVGDRSLVLTEKQREDEINEKLKTGIWE